MKKCQWAEQNVFCSDGAVLIDNNVSEREIEARRVQSKKFPIRGQPARRADACDPGKLDQHLPPARR